MALCVYFAPYFIQAGYHRHVAIEKEPIIFNDAVVGSLSPMARTENKEENEHGEVVSDSLFYVWQGRYILEQEDQVDAWGRESILFAELNLIKPDASVFKTWLADSNGKRYSSNDNYQEYIGAILATPRKDSVVFYTQEVVSGGNGALSPLLILTKENEHYFIYSLITSPPHNGIVQVPIEKQ